ncbi:MAG: hypothetical protein D6694_04875 [Gammaproteobacteria bacterium]|nr:MAG: hypothetical protein D6694_04875 [Gammaproteobacteria bacterium]
MDKYQHVIADMAVNSHLSTGVPSVSWHEEQTVAPYIISYLRNKFVSLGSGEFKGEFQIFESLSKDFDWIRKSGRKNFNVIADSTSWIHQTFDPSLSAQEIIDLFENLDIPYASRLAKRLRYLYELREEELPEEMPLSTDSIFSFYLFMEQNPSLAYPQVTLTSEGDIHAVWSKSSNKLLSIDFTGKTSIRYVLFTPNRLHPGHVIRVSALTTRDQLLEQISPYRIDFVFQRG